MGSLSGVAAERFLDMKRTADGTVLCMLSESLITSLLKRGAVKAEQLQCMDETSAAQLKKIVLRSCR
ncbi:hypothetical protein [Congregibacter sp.]|uniref:hypothetical protein n=1 Tax=Congregibacter sp. TaxID=2744308 RepID=UPI003F6B676B